MSARKRIALNIIAVTTAINIKGGEGAGCHNPLQPSSRAARKWRKNEEMKRKWRENEEMERE